MAWLDERIWCHPKFTDVSNDAFRVYIHGLAYSAGFGRRGVLTSGQQQLLGSTPELYRELVDARLWEERDEGAIEIHNWEEHNGPRDDRKEADRKRKRAARLSAKNGADAPPESDADVPPQNGADAPRLRRALKSEEVKSEVKKEPFGFLEIVDFWLGRAPPLIKHRDSIRTSSKVRKAAVKAVGSYGLDDVLEAIGAYADVLGSPAHFFEYRWTLPDFLRRGLPKFVPEADPLSNYTNRPIRRDNGMSFEEILAMNGGDHERRALTADTVVGDA